MAAAQAFVLTAQQVGIKMPREVHNVNHAQSTRFLKEQVPPRWVSVNFAKTTEQRECKKHVFQATLVYAKNMTIIPVTMLNKSGNKRARFAPTVRFVPEMGVHYLTFMPNLVFF
jgi:hypothetical protein